MPLLLLLVKPSPNELFVFFVSDQKKREKKSMLDFTGIRPGFAGIIIEGILGKKIKSGHVRRLVIAVLTDRVLELKIFETLRGLIEKIETLGVELKIAANFEG